MPYDPVNWVDGVTPENAATLGQMDQGIEDAHQAIADIIAGGVGGGIEYENDWVAATAYQAGDVVRYRGVDYLAVNPSTGSEPPPYTALGAALPVAIGTSFPASPFDGQEFILTDSLTEPTYHWRFRYTPSVVGAYKWVFIGGSEYTQSLGSETTSTSGSYVDLPTIGPSFIAPRPGDYDVAVTAAGRHTVAGAELYLNLMKNVSALYAQSILTGMNASAITSHTPLHARYFDVVAGEEIRVRYMMSAAGTGTWLQRFMRVTPRRLG